MGPHRFADRNLQDQRHRTLRLLAYLKATLTAIANGHAQSRIDDLLPWNFKPPSQADVLSSERLRRKASVPFMDLVSTPSA